LLYFEFFISEMTISTSTRSLWFERLMALLASANLLLVLFDLSYVPWRNLYLQKLPQVTYIYDRFKGIEPHRETSHYLKTVDVLTEQVSQTGLQSSQVAKTLAELRNLSNEMVDSNPFAGVGKSGTLEKIKNRMRDRINIDSSKQAFSIFWSQPYLTQRGWTQEISFFNKSIKPLIATNYYRRIGEDSEFIDDFWLIDLPFVLIFAIELLVRSYYIKRSHPGFSWFNAILWRWYDLFLVIPFLRWLRVIPVVVRLDQVKLLNLHPLRQQIHQGIIANFAEEITEIVIVRLINQIQGSIQRGDFQAWLRQNDTLRPYIDINNINEVEAIGSIFVQTILYQVLPKIQPEAIAILRHTIDSALKQAPISRDLQNFPGVGQIQLQLSEQLATQIATNLYNTIVSAVEDPVGAKLSSQLVQRFTESFGAELQNKHILSELQKLAIDFLEEIKLNYVQQMSEAEMMQILEQTRRLRTKPSVQPVGTISPVKSLRSNL
jgi:hypothetical protein